MKKNVVSGASRLRTPALAAMGTVALAASLLATSTPVAAGGYHHPRPGTPATVAEGFVSPLSLEIGRGGTAYLTQNFAGIVTAVDRAGESSELASAPGFETSAVSSRGSTVYYAKVAMDHSSAELLAVKNGSEPRVVADLYEHEATANPDQKNRYGFVDLPQACADQIPPDTLVPASYNGIVDTHPYASLATSKGIYVADAGANAILKVGYNGRVSTVAVLPPGDPKPVSAELAEQVGFPDCVVGYRYRFEPVPTDIELGPDGRLYVTSLPGGPEDASLGARGAVYKVSPWSGSVRKVAGGLVGATGLAVSPSGTIYVAELFGGDGSGQISVIRHGAARPFVTVGQPAAIEISGKRLYVTTDALADGPLAKLTVIPLSSKHRG